MANQAIALMARAPQTDILGPSMARNAQMINQMSQQRAAERQAAQAQQQMQLAQAKEAREASMAEIELAGKKIDYYTKRAGQVMNAAGYQRLLQEIDKDAPEIAGAFRENLPPENFSRDMLLRMIGSVGDNFKATYGPLETQVVQRDDGTYMVIRTGGFEEPGAYEIPEYAYTSDQPPAAGAAPTPPKLSQPTPTAPEALDAAAQAIASGKGINDPALRNLPPAALDEAQKRAMRLRLDTMPPVEGSMQPMSARQGQPDLAQVVNDMMATGFVTQSNLEAMRQVAGPDKDAQLAEILRSNNIQIVPDEGAGQFRSAVYRPEQDVGMQEVGYAPTGRAARGKPPMQGTVPGEYSLPTGEIRRREQAKRETPQEVYQKELARRRAERDAAIQGGPKPLTPVQEAKLRDNIAKDYKSARSTIDMMLNPVSGVVAAVNAVRDLSPDQKEAITGWSGYIRSFTASSRQADTKVKNLKGKVTEMGKAAASLTGAIGQMAVQEWRIVSDMIANLDLEGMEPSDLDNQLDIIESQAKRAAEITQDAYENQYVEEFARYGDRFRLKTPQAPAAKGGGKSSGWGKARVVGD